MVPLSPLWPLRREQTQQFAFSLSKRWQHFHSQKSVPSHRSAVEFSPWKVLTHTHTHIHYRLLKSSRVVNMDSHISVLSGFINGSNCVKKRGLCVCGHSPYVYLTDISKHILDYNVWIHPIRGFCEIREDLSHFHTDFGPLEQEGSTHQVKLNIISFRNQNN